MRNVAIFLRQNRITSLKGSDIYRPSHGSFIIAAISANPSTFSRGLNTLPNIPRRLRSWFERFERQRNGGTSIGKSTSAWCASLKVKTSGTRYCFFIHSVESARTQSPLHATALGSRRIAWLRSRRRPWSKDHVRHGPDDSRSKSRKRNRTTFAPCEKCDNRLRHPH